MLSQMDRRFFTFLALFCLPFLSVTGEEEVVGVPPCDQVVTQNVEVAQSPAEANAPPDAQKTPPTCPPDKCEGGYTVNFENVRVIELIRFISQIADVNFIYDSAILAEHKVTIVSEESASAQELLSMLLQILRMHGLSVVEQGKNVLIYGTDNLAKVATIVTDETVERACTSPVVTRVFRLYNLLPDKVATIVRPLLSKEAVVEVLNETRNLIISDITANVSKVAELLTALDMPNAALDVGEYPVTHVNPAVLASYAKEILAPLAQENPLQLIPQQSARKVFLISTPYLIAKAMQVLASLDSAEMQEEVASLPATAMANNNFYVYKLKYRGGSDIATALQDIGNNLQYTGVGNSDLISAIYSIQWMEVNNSIVITGTQESIDKIIALLNDLDTAPSQVYIEVLIIDTTLQNSLNFGVDWVALGNEQNKLAFASGLLSAPPSTAPVSTLTGQPQATLFGGSRAAQSSPPPNASRGGSPGTGGDIPLTSGFGLGIVGNILSHNGMSILTLGALVNALQGDSKTSIVLNPRIMAQDRREANFFVGQNIPYQTTSTVIRDTGSVTGNFQYEDIGIQLRVTPQVGPNGIVTLEIDQSVSEVTEQITGNVNTQNFFITPTTSKTLATTRVHVPDGCFLVMSGHVRDFKSLVKTGIPCLGSLPLIGSAFSNTVETREKRNMIMFIQPHLVTDFKEGEALSNQQGCQANWDNHPASLRECGQERAPEAQNCQLRPDEPVKKPSFSLDKKQ